MERRQPLRVIVWSTGGIGSIAIQAIHGRPGLDLVGAWVHSPDKIGRDAGDLANAEPIGIVATNDAESLIALRPDCIVYAASGPERDAAAVPDVARLLEAGINVVCTTLTGAVYPPAYDPKRREELTAAAQAGGASFYASGIEPGFAADQLPLLLTTQSSRVRSVHSYEIALYDDYPVASVMMDAMGFGRPMAYTPMISTPGAILASWSGQIQFVADVLGVEVDAFRETFEKAPTHRTLEVACGTLEKGTCGAVRIQAIGVIGGKDAIVLDHVTRMAPDMAPDWPVGPYPVTYRIEIEGEPNIQCDMGMTVDDAARAGIPGMTSGAGAMVATAMRAVNAIPYVVNAAPGLLSSLDLPLTVPVHGFEVPA